MPHSVYLAHRVTQSAFTAARCAQYHMPLVLCNYAKFRIE